MPQTPRIMQQLRSVAYVAEKTLTVSNNRPLVQLSAQVANLSKMEHRMMDALSNKLSAAVQTMSSSWTTRPPTNSRINTQYKRRPYCNYCGRYCLSKESYPARFAFCRFRKIKGHFENVCRKAKRNQTISTQNRSFQR